MKKQSINEVRFREYVKFYKSMGATLKDAEKMAKELMIKEDMIWYTFLAGGIVTFIFIVLLVIK